jgi:hypothetical protein
VARAMKEPREEQIPTFAYQVSIDTGGLISKFIVELNNRLDRDPNASQERYVSQLRQALRRAMQGERADMSLDTVVCSVREINPLTGNEERAPLERLSSMLNRGDVRVAPVVRMR